jgi:hypothetical protein
VRRREEDPDGSVSEDEPDELMGILSHRVVSLVAGGAEGATGQESVAAPLVTSSVGSAPALFTDNEALRNPFTTHDNTIPEDILTLVKC